MGILTPRRSVHTRKTTAVLGLGTVSAYDTFTRADASGLGTTDSGESWADWLSGDGWEISSNQAVPTGTGTSTAYFDASVSDGAAQCALKFAGGLLGIVFRGVDADNYLWADLTAGQIRIQKRASGSNSSLATQAITLTSGETYTLGVKFISDKVDAVVKDLAGREVGTVSHTLSSGDQTTYGSATNMGLTVFNSSSSAVSSLVVRSAL